MNKIYRQDIDFLKGIAILGVVLYHIGILPAGYLGVDIFFVVNGFLVIPSLCTKLENGEFQYWFFIKRKLMRMYPLLLAACTISLILAIFFMLPDDLLTTAESVVASLFFLNNGLSLFLTGDYWDWTNDFKPLMHIWYLAILVQIYFILPCLMLLGNKIAKKINLSKGVVYKTILIFISILSVILFINPNLSSWNRFYLVQYRIFEFTVGGIAGVFCNEYRNSDKVSNVTNKVNILINILCYGIIICILLGGENSLIQM